MTSPTKKPLFLSASRIDTFQFCSQQYAARYIHKIPDSGNSGSSRGSVVHDVLELLVKPRHQHHVKTIVDAKTCRKDPSVWKLLLAHSRKNGVADEENLKLIDGFMLVALKNEFLGPPGTKTIVGEQEFSLEVNHGGRRFNARGFIDRSCVVEDKHGLLLAVTDFKSSKQKFQGDKAEDNIQAQMYQLALRQLYPDIKRRTFDFLFLKFPRAPIQEMPSYTDDQLDGFEWRLTFLQEAMENFTLDNQGDNLAAWDESKRRLCGYEGVKKDGTKAWICGAQKPLDYWVTVDETGAIVTSAFTEAELKPKAGHTVEKRRYPGCIFFYNPDTGQRRNFS